MDRPIESYKYQRKCALSRCKRLFGTNYKKQIFCKNPHRIIYYDLKRRETTFLYKKMAKLEKDLWLLAMRTDKDLKKAVKEAGRMAVFLAPKKGGGNSTDTTKNKKVKARDRGGWKQPSSLKAMDS